MRERNGIEQCRAAYARAYAFYRARRFEAAEAALHDAWRESGVRSLQGELLLAYLCRETGRPVSEVRVLQSLLETFAAAPESGQLAEAWSLLGAAQRRLGLAEAAVVSFSRAASLEPSPFLRLEEYSNAIFSANAIAGNQAEHLQALYAQYRATLAALGARPYAPRRLRHRRLRIGYVSADLRRHAVAEYVRPLFEDYDRERFVPYIYARVKRPDDVTRALRSGQAHWREAQGWTFRELAAQIHADEIDILFELGGHTAENALPVFAWRAAPVQICGIGYFNSTGLRETTGFLSDVFCAPEAHSPYFTELLLRLPHSHFCYAPFAEFPAVTPPPCLVRGYPTFGCFNNFAKVNDAMLRIWRHILLALPEARLVLKHALFDSEEGRIATLARLGRLGLPLTRIELRGYGASYLQEYGEVDIALDPSPYPGGATTCEALMMGVPVVTLAGDRHGARFGVSFLANAGLPELIAADETAYVETAVQLARDARRLCRLRQELRGRMTHSPLMDRVGYMRELEALYERLAVACPRCAW